jgi:hypothetical protein
MRSTPEKKDIMMNTNANEDVSTDEGTHPGKELGGGGEGLADIAQRDARR